jgi:hypothetical protein
MATPGGSARKRRGGDADNVAAWVAQAGQLQTRARTIQKDHTQMLQTLKVRKAIQLGSLRPGLASQYLSAWTKLHL